MRLHMFPFAPNAAKVRLYLAEKAAAGAPVEHEEVLVNLIESEQNSPEFHRLNPFGAVPVLELDDGRCIHESLAIIEYCEEIQPAASMWGGDAETRAYARQIERIADLSGLVPIAREIHATNSPLGLPPDPKIAAYHHDRWLRGIEFLEDTMADGRPFLAGDSVTVGDCTLQAILQFARFRDFDALADAPRLADWCARFRERPAAKATIVV